MAITNFSFENQTCQAGSAPPAPPRPACSACSRQAGVDRPPRPSLQPHAGSANPREIHSVLHSFCLQNVSLSFEMLPNNGEVASVMDGFLGATGD